MKFKTFGNRNDPAVLFFHAMGVTGESSEPVANYLQDRYFCILPTSTVYCKGQRTYIQIVSGQSVISLSKNEQKSYRIVRFLLT